MTQRAPRRTGDNSPAADDRGLSPVVGKTLELGIGVLLVALLAATFFGTVAPDYRAAVGSEVGDRTLSAAANRVEATVPDAGPVRVDRRVAVRLPATIRGDPYRIVADGGQPASLRLVHPSEAVDGRIRLDLPESAVVRGSLRSTSPSQVVVDATASTVSVRLVDAEPGSTGSAETTQRPAEGSA